MNGRLFLFPTTLGDTDLNNVLPEYNIKLISDIKFFIVEDLRSARRFLKKCNRSIDIDTLSFFELNEHTAVTEIAPMIQPLLNGHDMGVLSEAGCPAVADPGADVVALAQQKNIQVVPLVGPSSILMALMASGFNGQSFAFNGYLPLPADERKKSFSRMEQRIFSEAQTQLFIETPYRNDKTFKDILLYCRPDTRLCIAFDITLPSEKIRTLSLREWKQLGAPEFVKKPCLFVLYR